jgi:hypothetical protein
MFAQTFVGSAGFSDDFLGGLGVCRRGIVRSPEW